MSAPRQFKMAHVQRRGDVMNRDVVAGTCKAVTDAIRDIYALESGHRTIGFEDLYRRAYMMILHERGEELYSAVEAAMAAEVQGLAESLAAAPADDGGAAFLRELLAVWRRHAAAVSAIRDMVMYMDRTFVPATRRAPVRELALGLWRDGVVRSEKVRPRLVEAVRWARGGGDTGGDLVAGVTEMLTELGDEVCREVMDAPAVS